MRKRRTGLPAVPPSVAAAVPRALREARRRWAELLQQIFEVDPLRCRRCGAAMRIVDADRLAFLTQRDRD